MSKLTTNLTCDQLISGALTLNMELPEEVKQQIAASVGNLLSENELRKVRLQSAEKMREEIRQATKKVLVEDGLYAEIQMNVGSLVENEIRRVVSKVLTGKENVLEKHIRVVFDEMISQAVGNPKGPASGDRLGQMLEKIVAERVKEFVTEQLIIRFVPKEATF